METKIQLIHLILLVINLVDFIEAILLSKILPFEHEFKFVFMLAMFEDGGTGCLWVCWGKTFVRQHFGEVEEIGFLCGVNERVVLCHWTKALQ